VFRTILVALDSSELSERVVRSLDEFQIQSDTHVILVHVIPPAEPGLEKPADQPQVEPEISYQKIENQLQLYQGSLAYRSVREIVSGDPAEEIVRLANIYHADLIILGSRGLTGMERILQGSVSSQVAADAPCSVLVIKPS